ncbi:MAG TPA: ABC transporter permease [Anaerolineales bacterium]|nr:ABC transporter permease [Anaerolineales bacterium]
MKSFIGGLFKNREAAEAARRALLQNGFTEPSINMLECTHEKEAVVLKENPSIQSIGVGALAGAIIGGLIGAALGFLVGSGVIQLPSLGPSGGATVPFQITSQFTFTSVVTGLIFGVVTGIILGVATRLLTARYKKVDTLQTANKGDLMLAVQTNDIHKKAKARTTLKEHGAFKFEEFGESWDAEVWSELREEISQTG